MAILFRRASVQFAPAQGHPVAISLCFRSPLAYRTVLFPASCPCASPCDACVLVMAHAVMLLAVVLVHHRCGRLVALQLLRMAFDLGDLGRVGDGGDTGIRRSLCQRQAGNGYCGCEKPCTCFHDYLTFQRWVRWNAGCRRLKKLCRWHHEIRAYTGWRITGARCDAARARH